MLKVPESLEKWDPALLNLLHSSWMWFIGSIYELISGVVSCIYLISGHFGKNSLVVSQLQMYADFTRGQGTWHNYWCWCSPAHLLSHMWAGLSIRGFFAGQFPGPLNFRAFLMHGCPSRDVIDFFCLMAMIRRVTVVMILRRKVIPRIMRAARMKMVWSV